MYYLLLLLTLAGCAGAPYDAINDSDAASDGGDVGDLLGGRHHDSAVTDDDAGTDQVADLDAAAEPNVDVDAAVTPGTDAAIAIDADAAVPDATVPASLGTTCDSCTVDADCANNHVCVFRGLDAYRVCAPYTGEISGTADCDAFAPSLTPTGGRLPDPAELVCLPHYMRTCASWLAEFGP